MAGDFDEETENDFHKEIKVNKNSPCRSLINVYSKSDWSTKKISPLGSKQI